MSIIELGCRLVYQVHFETSFIFQITVLESRQQIIEHEALSFEAVAAAIPAPESDADKDPDSEEPLEPDTPAEPEVKVARIGSAGHRIHRLLVQPGWFTVNYTATVSSNPTYVTAGELGPRPHAELPADVLPYLHPSRYCESDRLEQFAWKTFGKAAAEHARVLAVTDWVYGHLTYTPGSTGPSTTACDVFLQRSGVCRDFAHLTITLCRALGIPARYVAGYAVNLVPPDFHGFVEVFLDDDWYLFDATRLAPVDGFVRIGIGRDAADLSFANYVGNSTMRNMHVWASETSESARTSDDTPAVSLAISLG